MGSEDDTPVRDFTSEAQTSNRGRQNQTLEQFRQGYKGKGLWSVSADKKIIQKAGEEAPEEKPKS